MPLDSDVLKELKGSLSAARKKEMNFALCMGKKAEGTVLIIDRIKDPGVLFKLAKREGETAKVTSGKIKVDGSKALLNCIEEPPAGCGRKLKQFFAKTVGVSLKVNIQDVAGNVLEGDDEDETQEDAQPSDSEENAQRRQWNEMFETLEPQVQSSLEAGKGDIARIKKVWDFACGKAEDEDFEAALKMAGKIPEILAEAIDENEVSSDSTEDDTGAPADEAGPLQPSEAEIDSALTDSLREEFEALGADIKTAASSMDKGMAKKSAMLSQRFEADLTQDPKRASSVLTLLKTTLKTAIDAGIATPGVEDPSAVAARRSELAELEKGVDELLAEFS